MAGRVAAKIVEEKDAQVQGNSWLGKDRKHEVEWKSWMDETVHASRSIDEVSE